jgi:trafficking protein particle complex subunit 13
MYLGETFHCYVVIHNESPLLVTNVTVKIELQTTSQKFILAESKSNMLKTSETLDVIMSHEVKEMGRHM